MAGDGRYRGWLGGGDGPASHLVTLDRQGTRQLLDAPPRDCSVPRMSPSGDRIAVGVIEGDERQIWVYDIAAATSTQLTFDSAQNQDPAWSPDGTRISFTSNRTGAWELFIIPADRSGPAEPIPGLAARNPCQDRRTACMISTRLRTGDYSSFTIREWQRLLLRLITNWTNLLKTR
jgi:dipeptidyl aminopeptidase/acylaminoacyl peptidase